MTGDAGSTCLACAFPVPDYRTDKERFLRDVEEDPELRANIHIYKGTVCSVYAVCFFSQRGCYSSWFCYWARSAPGM